MAEFTEKGKTSRRTSWEGKDENCVLKLLSWRCLLETRVKQSVTWETGTRNGVLDAITAYISLDIKSEQIRCWDDGTFES